MTISLASTKNLSKERVCGQLEPKRENEKKKKKRERKEFFVVEITVQRVIGPQTTIAEDSVYRTHRRDGGWIAYPLRQKLIADFPCKHTWIFLFEAQDFLDNRRRGHLLERNKAKRKSDDE